MQVELLAMGYNYIQVGAQSWGTRMATKPMSNIGPIAMPHQSVNDLYGLPWLAQRNPLYNQVRQALPQLYCG